MSTELLDYIKQARRQGMTPERIRQVLVGEGWAEDQVKTAFNQYHYMNPGEAPAAWEQTDEAEKAADSEAVLVRALGEERIKSDPTAALSPEEAAYRPALAEQPENDEDQGIERKIGEDEVYVGGTVVSGGYLPIVGVAMILGGLLMLLIGYSIHRSDRDFVKRAETTVGTVIEIESGRHDRSSEDVQENFFRHPDLWLAGGKTLYRPIVEFGAGGKAGLKVSGKWRSDPNYYSLNQRVEVAYDPDDVSDRRLNTEEEIGDFSRSVVWFGVGLLAVGMALYRGSYLNRHGSGLNRRGVLDV